MAQYVLRNPTRRGRTVGTVHIAPGHNATVSKEVYEDRNVQRLIQLDLLRLVAEVKEEKPRQAATRVRSSKKESDSPSSPTTSEG